MMRCKPEIKNQFKISKMKIKVKASKNKNLRQTKRN